ncbi:hypothetical protein B0T18DRAFT_94023 [Schizothecium vesticola]|uniref:Uncharacterized protein n=1 Tax=Schizothecium vesticola TaxID=314040 RepID=A0AA40KB96_9PEZI|nr:hypothetical protein B0T18DRAFT_94023 [Schizothecium vesticola]
MDSRQMGVPLAVQQRMADIARRWDIASLDDLLPPGLSPPQFSRNLIMLLNRLSRHLIAADASHRLQEAIRCRRATETLANKKVAKREYLTRADALKVIADNDIPDLRFGADADEDGPSHLDQRRASLDPSEPSIDAATGSEERAHDTSSISTSFSSGTSNASRNASPTIEGSKDTTPESSPLEDTAHATHMTPRPKRGQVVNPPPLGHAQQLTPPSSDSGMSSDVNGSANSRKSARGLDSETITPSPFNYASGPNQRTSPTGETLKRRWAELEDDVNLEVTRLEGRTKLQQALLDCAHTESDDAHEKHAAIESRVALLTAEAESMQLECLHLQDRLPATVLALQGLLPHIFLGAKLPTPGADLDIRDPGGAIAQTIITFRDTVAAKLRAKEELEQRLETAMSSLHVAAKVLESKVSEVTELEQLLAELERELDESNEMSRLLSKKRR